MKIRKKLFLSSISFFIFIFLSVFCFSKSAHVPQQKTSSTISDKMGLLKLLGIIPCPESIDYIQNKTQFQLHTLLTEQRHPKTWNLSEQIQKDYEAGLHLLLDVDEDIAMKLKAMAQNTGQLEQLANAIQQALLSKKKIYIYGCGATGRLAKQMESTFWRPFWKKVKENEKIWAKIKPHIAEPIEEQLIGEMTGADRALISSLEGFEDLQIIGRLQLEDRKIKTGDVVICVTEGGETSSVIGTILAALDQWKEAKAYEPEKTRTKLYFLYNNPDDVLRPFDRSRIVLDEPGITKINLFTGPQAITGSTRMQATTIETFVLGHVLQEALERTLRQFLSKKDMSQIGFGNSPGLEKRLNGFSEILNQVKKNIPSIAKFTQQESQTYANGHFSTYFAQKGLITVFIDSTERSPTFRLFPLDTVKEKKRKCWIQVWTPAANLKDAWQAFLGRPFLGLSPEVYKEAFEREITDSYLKTAALESLKNAGSNQQFLYDFSFSEFNIVNRGPKQEDLGVCVLISPEELGLKSKDSPPQNFINLFLENKASIALILITQNSENNIMKITGNISGFSPDKKDSLVVLRIDGKSDPLGVNQQIALKIVLNAHSTGVMARLGKVIGNTMTNVSPSNLKLIGRATYLIQSHVNDVLSNPRWVKQYGLRKQISYGEANAVLFEAIRFLKHKKNMSGQTAEVALSIIHILESLRLKKAMTQEEAFSIVKTKGLSEYLAHVTS
ncbi:MAG: hypothetical protein U9O50_07655 [Acidobacteriota bacterium]|nr:hypothetical protein [Acidobacteriota bacterium]